MSPYSPDTLRELEHHPHPAWLWDAERRRIIWSNRAGLAFWHEETVLDLIDRRFDIHTPSIERIVALARELKPDERVTESFVFEVPAGNDDGSPEAGGITAQCRAMALEDGRTGVLTVAQAVETLGADQSARASLFETVAGELPVAVAVFDRHGSLLYRNAACRGLLDDEPGTGELLEQWLGGQPRARDIIRQTLSLGSLSVAMAMHTRFGERAQRITARRICAPTQGRLAVLMCFQDIEDRRRHERGIAARLEKLEAWLAAVADFTFELDEDLRLAGPASVLAERLGLPDEELTGRYWAQIADAAGIDSAGEILARLAAGDPARARITLGGGQGDRHILLSFSPVTDTDGVFAGFAGTGVLLAPVIQPETGRPGAPTAPESARTEPAPEVQAPQTPRQSTGAQAQAIPGAGPKPATPAKPATGPKSGEARETPAMGGEDAEAFSAIARALASRPGGTASTATLEPNPEDAKSTGQRAAALRVVGGLESISSSAPAAPTAPVLPIPPAAPAAPVAPAAPAAPIPVIESVERLEKISEPALVHRNFNIVYANRAMDALFGQPGADGSISDNNLLNLFPDERARLFSLQSKFDDGEMPSQTELFDVKLRARAPDRSTVTIVTSIAPVIFKGEAAIRMIFESDVRESAPALVGAPAPAGPDGQPEAPPARPETTAGETDRELRESKARENELRAVINSAADGIATLDHEGRILTLNASAESIFGVTAPDVVGQPLCDLFQDAGAKTVDAYIQSLGQARASKLYSEGCEVVGRRKDGGAPQLYVTVGRMKVENGLRFCVVIRDITQWKATQDTLRHEKEEAERASTRKSDFLAKVSHELRTPLNAIIGFSEVMSEEKFGPIANDRYKGYLADIHASGGHLLSLINDLLDLSKIESGNLELNFTSVDVGGIVRQAVGLLEPQAARERVIIRTSLPDSLPPVVADDRSVRQIVLNLVSNAIKFTPPGGQVILSVLVDEAGQVQIRVRDTGVGMSQEELADAMVPFRQINNGEHTDLAGTGLGLPLTRALTEANRAEFKIESTPNAGTLVQVIFPTNRVLAS